MQGNNNLRKWNKILKLKKKLNNDERMWYSYAYVIYSNDDNTWTWGPFQKTNEKKEL